MDFLCVRDLSENYQAENGELLALDHIDFTVKKGEFVSIVGPSGCGKSTLLSIIAGLLPPTSGSILLDGKEVHGVDPRIGYMLQKDNLLEWRTIWKNVLFGLEVRRRLDKESTDRARRLLESYGLWEFRDSYPSQLSGGMRQRAALIRTLATDPEILLLDEPFSALDYQTRLNVCDDVAAIIRSEGKTALLITHDISEAISLADRVLVLSSRPARVAHAHTLDFGQLNPLKRREQPQFSGWFELLWRELNG